MPIERPIERMYCDDEIVCIGCGCSDSRACEGGCCWVAVDEEARVGICSTCAAKPIAELAGTAASLGADFPADADRIALADALDLPREVA